MKAILILAVLLIAVFVPVIPEPFYHKRRVPLLLWLVREIEEFYTGERAKDGVAVLPETIA